MYNSEEHLKIVELRNLFSQKPQVLEKIKTIESLHELYKLDVLLIDDDEVNNFMYSEYLNNSDKVSKINIENNPIEALDYLQELHEDGQSFPKLIMLDVEMPIMNAGEFLEAFKNRFPRKRTKIILFTLHDKDHVLKEMENNRVIGYMQKPFNMEKFEEIIKENFISK